MQTRALQIVFISSVNRTVWMAVLMQQNLVYGGKKTNRDIKPHYTLIKENKMTQ